jgi:hypothetical protein
MTDRGFWVNVGRLYISPNVLRYRAVSIIIHPARTKHKAPTHAAMTLIPNPEWSTGGNLAKEEYMEKAARQRAAIPGKTTSVKPPALFYA